MDFPAFILSSLERAPWGWSLLLVVLVTLIKTWPVIQLQTITARATLRGERKDELHNCQDRLDAMEGKLNTAISHIHQLDLKLVGTVSAYRILHDHMNDVTPDHPALHQARTIFQTTWDGPVEAAGSLISGLS